MAVLRGLSAQVSEQVVELDPGGTSVGRDDGQRLVLHDGSVSLKHARLWCETKWLVEDLGSTNKTLLNGAELDAHEVFELQDGDRLSFGNVVLQLDAVESTGALGEARTLLEQASEAIDRMSEELALLREHTGKQDEAIRSRDQALEEWDRRMHDVNASWMSREEFDREVARMKQELEAAAQARVDASVRRYNEMEARYVQVQARLETAERSVRDKDEQLRNLALRRA